MKYCIATNTGVGFYTHEDREIAWLSGHTGNVWAVGDANYSWIQRVNGVEKTLSEAQEIIDQIVLDNQSVWDNNNVEGETEQQKIIRLQSRPSNEVLPSDVDDAAFITIK
jgi:nitrous oxidase accessory protein NosD